MYGPEAVVECMRSGGPASRTCDPHRSSGASGRRRGGETALVVLRDTAGMTTLPSGLPGGPPSTDSPIRWGVIGTGWIATTFVRDLALLADAKVAAVGSRRQESADAFADVHGIAKRHSSYADLVTDPEVDVVYVSTPHPAHHAAARLAIDAGKAVLVEKPFTLNANEAKDLVAAARHRGTFLMEAMWTRFLPHVVAIRELVSSGGIGELVSVVADHGQWFPENADHRLFAPELGGGALLDLGVYPISFVSLFLGAPTRVLATSSPAFTGVDAHTSVLLEHADGTHGVVHTTLSASTATTAVINATEGRIEVSGPFYRPNSYRLHTRGSTSDGELVDIPVDGHGLRFQAAEVGRCLRAGLTESPDMPLDESVSIMETLDEVRRQIGLTYPAEALA